MLMIPTLHSPLEILRHWLGLGVDAGVAEGAVSVRIDSIHFETLSRRVLVLKPEGTWPAHCPGQTVLVTLREPEALRGRGPGAAICRRYTLLPPTAKGLLRLAVDVRKNDFFSDYLALRTRRGDRLALSTISPAG